MVEGYLNWRDFSQGSVELCTTEEKEAADYADFTD